MIWKRIRASRARKRGAALSLPRPTGNWLTGGALWTFAAGMGAFAIWGAFASMGALAFAVLPFQIAAAVMGNRFAVHASRAPSWPRWAGCIVALAVCVAVDGWGEHRAFGALNEWQARSYTLAATGRAAQIADVDELRSRLEPVPELPDASVTSAARISAIATEREKVRTANAKIQAKIDAAKARQIATVTRPPDPLSDVAIWVLVAGSLFIQAFGFWAMSPGSADVVRLQPLARRPAANPPSATTPAAAPVPSGPPLGLKPGELMLWHRGGNFRAGVERKLAQREGRAA